MSKARLILQESIQQHVGQLIRAAEDFLNGFANSKQLPGDLKSTQMRNLVNVAKEAPHVAVISNFLRYQIGRDNRQSNWGSNQFGSRLIEEIGKIKTIAEKVKEETAAASGEMFDAEEIHLELVRQFLGYLNRHFVFLKPDAQGRD